jgi:hypothetical protein
MITHHFLKQTNNEDDFETGGSSHRLFQNKEHQ